MIVLVVDIQIHEARSTESLRLLFQVDNKNAELRWTPESPVLAGSSQLHRAAQLERGRSDEHRQKPSLQEMSFRQVSAQERRVSSHDDECWRHDRSHNVQIPREIGERGRRKVDGT